MMHTGFRIPDYGRHAAELTSLRGSLARALAAGQTNPERAAVASAGKSEPVHSVFRSGLTEADRAEHFASILANMDAHFDAHRPAAVAAIAKADLRSVLADARVPVDVWNDGDAFCDIVSEKLPAHRADELFNGMRESSDAAWQARQARERVVYMEMVEKAASTVIAIADTATLAMQNRLPDAADTLARLAWSAAHAPTKCFDREWANRGYDVHAYLQTVQTHYTTEVIAKLDALIAGLEASTQRYLH